MALLKTLTHAHECRLYQWVLGAYLDRALCKSKPTHGKALVIRWAIFQPFLATQASPTQPTGPGAGDGPDRKSVV